MARSPKCAPALQQQVARSPKCPQPHFLQTELLGRVILLNNFGSFIEGEKDRLRCVRALSRVLVHLNVRCGRCHRHRMYLTHNIGSASACAWRRGRGYIPVPRHQCTGAKYGKTSKRGSRRNEEIRLTHAQGENEKCRNWHRKYRNWQNHVRVHSTRMPRPSSRFSTVNNWDPFSLLIHSFSRSRRCTMSVGALSRTVTRQEWSRCVKWTATYMYIYIMTSIHSLSFPQVGSLGVDYTCLLSDLL